ncbi:hypothetical protein [uncultured Sphaerochaeta sp.]|uniref:hypothetical protein n=1 Tax=uncultured Sphaerochaeta sp. TaxID=886478 RepID=UPI002A0A207C|nr:hypothetical protein [uncultured Sphaerochaeta sp.]
MKVPKKITIISSIAILMIASLNMGCTVLLARHPRHPKPNPIIRVDMGIQSNPVPPPPPPPRL